MSFPQPPHPGANDPTPFSLVALMMSNALSDHEKIECWKTIDIIYDNLLNDDESLRSFAEIANGIQQQFHNPSLQDGRILSGVNFARQVYRWFATHHDSGLIDQAVARLGQSKPFLRGLERYLTVAERENRRTESSDPKEFTPLPQDLLKSWSDALALRHWARVRTSRPVNPVPGDIPKDFEEKARLAKYIFDGMVAEPANMVERPKVGGQDKGHEQGKSKGPEIHAQVKRVREMSDLKKYILSWDWLVNAIDAEKGTPDTVLYCNEAFPKNGDYKNFRERIQSTHELVSPAYLTRFAANPKQELSTKVLNKGTNATRTRQVQAGQKVLAANAAKPQGPKTTKLPVKATRINSETATLGNGTVQNAGLPTISAEEYELQAARNGYQSAVSEPELAGQASASEPQSYNGNGVSSNTGVGSSNTLFDVDRTSLEQGTRAAEFVTNPMSAASTDAYSVPNLNHGPRDQHHYSLPPPPSTAHQTRESANTPFSTSHWGALDGTDSNLDLDMFEVNRSWYDAISATDPSRQHGPAIDADNAGVISPQLQGVTTARTGSTTNAASATHQSAVIWDSGYQGRNAFGDLPMNSFNQGATAPSGSPQIPGEPYTGFIAQALRAQTGNAAPFASSIAAPTLTADNNPPETIANDNFDWDYWIDQAWVGGEEPNDSEDES
ncbi:hypothetical protein NEUTE2DRAFT_60263 [Neurospora tetrasperma FGSC 2509]|nr:hypothetical protein NEUTE2DRAFT_60263 [Neurospora tetrasperma FGSC 2509]